MYICAYVCLFCIYISHLMRRVRYINLYRFMYICTFIYILIYNCLYVSFVYRAAASSSLVRRERYVNMDVCICIWKFKYKHTSICKSLSYIFVLHRLGWFGVRSMSTWMYAYAYENSNIYIHIYVSLFRTYLCCIVFFGAAWGCVHTHKLRTNKTTRTRTQTHTHNAHTYIHTYAHITRAQHAHTHSPHVFSASSPFFVQHLICMNLFTFVYICIGIYTYVYMQVYTGMFLYICVSVSCTFFAKCCIRV